MEIPLDSVPLSVLLEDLLQNQQEINWADIPSSDTVESLYSNLENSSSPPAISSSPELLAIAQDQNAVNENYANQNKTSDEDSEEESVNNGQNKRKRRESKNKSEAKRRVKFTEQLAMLRTMLLGDQNDAKPKKGSKVTREHLLGSAIQEIARLREELAQKDQMLAKPNPEPHAILQKLATGRFPMYHDYTQISLYDPLNRSAYSLQDLDRAFQIIFAREIDLYCCVSRKRSEQSVLHNIRMLQDMCSQLGKPEYSLGVGILEQTYHSCLRFNPREWKRSLEQNWNTYQAMRETDQSNLVLFIEGEVGAWILTDRSQLEYLTGNFEAAQHEEIIAKDLTKKLRHPGTNRFMLATLAWNLRGTFSVATAEKIQSILKGDYLWKPMGDVILGLSLVAAGQHKEGVEIVELAAFHMLERKDELIELCMAPALMEAYVLSRNVDKGLKAINYILKTYGDLNIEGSLGKAELLRQKANLLIMKKYPDFLPDLPLTQNDSVVEDLISMCQPDQREEIKPTYGPLVAGVIQSYFANNEPSNEDIEMLLRSAMNLAQIRGLHTIELRTAVTLTRYFLHSKMIDHALETVQIVKDCMAKMKGHNSNELLMARYVISQVEELQ